MEIRIPTIDDFKEVTLDEMQESYDLAMDTRIAQEIEEARDEEAREKNDKKA